MPKSAFTFESEFFLFGSLNLCPSAIILFMKFNNENNKFKLNLKLH